MLLRIYAIGVKKNPQKLLLDSCGQPTNIIFHRLLKLPTNFRVFFRQRSHQSNLCSITLHGNRKQLQSKSKARQASLSHVLDFLLCLEDRTPLSQSLPSSLSFLLFPLSPENQKLHCVSEGLPEQPIVYFSGSPLTDRFTMTAGEFLSIEPQELQFPFELRKQISCSLNLSNKTDDYVGFKVKTTNPKKYCVRPNTGVVLPRSTCNVIVTMQAQKEAPLDMQCKDKFLLQTVVASAGAAPKDITPEMFNKESGHHVEECKLRVVYVAPPRPPSPVREGSEEGSSPRASFSDNGSLNAAEFTSVSRPHVERHEPQNNSYDARSLISKLTDEKNSAIQQNNKLQQELELLRREAERGRGGIPFIYVILVGLVGIILGYLLKRT
ncbi:vesicle-associated protein 1-2-like [Durio zibethinus]|uniref:Vesicle-associated protein 1-2-like n=1 Tax=Durio zibethinus TaxID=66656 RepID=A0A6P6AZR1_DURZI|nr:vesicle-associated protein 1-2-like [Durio zibethinus]